MKHVLVALGALFLLSACEARLDLPQPRLKIDSGHSHGSNFCPPGQAKKGNC